jgi:hypothetical protein
MVYIQTLRISDDRQFIYLDVSTSTGNTIEKILLWKEDTYKDVTKAIDLSSYISGLNNREVLSIPISAVSEEEFKGIYFLEFTSTDTVNDDDCSDCDEAVAMGVTVDLTEYHDCILNQTMKVVLGGDNDEVLEAQLLLDNVYTSLRFGWYEEAISILALLEEYCGTDCVTCRELVVPEQKKNLGFGVLNGTMTLI